MALFKRLKSGISGFDSLIEGGFPENDIILLSGTCGAGKTIFGLQFLYNAAQSEPGIYVSFEEEIEHIKTSARAFGWDVDRLEKQKKLLFLKYDPFKLEDIFEIIKNNILTIGARRVVIDSISSLGIYVRDIPELRRMIIQLSSVLRKSKCTSMLISEILPNKKDSISRFGVEEFVSDSVVVMHNVLKKQRFERGISVWKMRATDHSRKIHPYDITKKGFVVYPNRTLLKD